MSYADVVKKTKETLETAFPKCRLEFKLFAVYADWIATVVDTSSTANFVYARGIGPDPDAASLALLENLGKYMCELAATQAAQLAAYQEKQTELLRRIAAAQALLGG